MRPKLITLNEYVTSDAPAGLVGLTIRNITVNANHLLYMTEYSTPREPNVKTLLTVAHGDQEKTLIVSETVEEIKSMINSKELLNG